MNIALIRTMDSQGRIVIPAEIRKQMKLSDGLFVLEHGKDNNFEENPHFIERRVYGSVNFSLFR